MFFLKKNGCMELFDDDLHNHLCLAAKRFFSSVKSLLFLAGGRAAGLQDIWEIIYYRKIIKEAKDVISSIVR
jgi:hypothetical protein